MFRTATWNTRMYATIVRYFVKPFLNMYEGGSFLSGVGLLPGSRVGEHSVPCVSSFREGTHVPVQLLI